MQEDKKEPPAAVPAGNKQPGFCDRVQKAFHTRPAFGPLRRLTARQQDGANKSADGGAAEAEPVRNRKHSGPPAPAPPVPTAPRAPRPAPVRLPAITTPTSKWAGVRSVPTGPPVPTPPSDVVKAGLPEADEKDGNKAQQSKWKNVVGFGVRKPLSYK